MDFSAFDARNYPTLPVEAGYGEWVGSYDETVFPELDLRLLERIDAIDWTAVERAADLACGTGRIGVWLAARGVARLDGVDLTPEMIARARVKGVYASLAIADVRGTPLEAGVYDLVTHVLADEHLPDVRPMYAEAARLCRPGGHLVVVGFHPHFLMSGVPTHFHRPGGEAVAIRSYVHQLSDHVAAALAAGFTIVGMDEGLVDEAWIARKPRWARFVHHPVSFALVSRAGS